jgi:hypothetical protein
MTIGTAFGRLAGVNAASAAMKNIVNLEDADATT